MREGGRDDDDDGGGGVSFVHACNCSTRLTAPEREEGAEHRQQPNRVRPNIAGIAPGNEQVRQG